MPKEKSVNLGKEPEKSESLDHRPWRRCTQYRQWATTYLREFLVKGFLTDDERLKNPGGWDYFNELLARIREIQSSEKRFYQKLRDPFALSSDYQARDQEARRCFAA